MGADSLSRTKLCKTARSLLKRDGEGGFLDARCFTEDANSKNSARKQNIAKQSRTSEAEKRVAEKKERQKTSKSPR